MEENLSKIQEYLKKATAVIITAGAGISESSGIVDFRGDEFGKVYPYFAGKDWEKLDVADWFKTDPQRAWAFFGDRYHKCQKSTPNESFAKLWNLVKNKVRFFFLKF